MGDQTIWLTPSRSHVGTTSSSMTRHSIEYCGWFDTMRSKPICVAMRTASSICADVHSETPM